MFKVMTRNEELHEGARYDGDQIMLWFVVLGSGEVECVAHSIAIYFRKYSIHSNVFTMRKFYEV